MENIKISSLKRLVTPYSEKVKFFTRSVGRLSGLVGLREQFRLKPELGRGMAAAEERELQRRIVRTAQSCASTLVRLNELAGKVGVEEPLPGVRDMCLAEIVDACVVYSTALALSSDYQKWVDKFEDSKS